MDDNKKKFVNNIIKYMHSFDDSDNSDDSGKEAADNVSAAASSSVAASQAVTASQAVADSQVVTVSQDAASSPKDAQPEILPPQASAAPESDTASDTADTTISDTISDSDISSDNASKPALLNTENKAGAEKTDTAKVVLEKSGSEKANKSASSNIKYKPRENREQSKDSFFSMLLSTIADRSVFGGLIIYIAFIVNIIGLIVFTRGSGLSSTQSILYIFHFDSIAFQSFTFTEISVLVSYFVTFLFGGLVLFILLRIGASIARLCDFIYSHKFTRLILFIFMAVLSAAALAVIISGKGILTIEVYKWSAPLFTLTGGLLMYCMSLRNVDIS